MMIWHGTSDLVQDATLFLVEPDVGFKWRGLLHRELTERPAGRSRYYLPSGGRPLSTTFFAAANAASRAATSVVYSAVR